MRIVFFGTGDIGLPALRWLLDNHEVMAVVAQPDKPAGRKLELTPPPTKRLAVERGVPVLQPMRIRDPLAVAELAAMKPDAVVVMAYGQILPKALLDLPKLACLNLHASLLPRQRGAAPIQAAIEAGDRECGITVMWVDVGLDTGDILLQHRVSIRRRETGGSLHDRIANLAPEALAEAIELLQRGQAPRIPQENALATYASKLSRESGIINWSAASAVIDQKVRAMNPWPAASTTLPGGPGGPVRNLKVFSVIQHRKESGTPGTVLWADRRGILVAAGSGAVLLRDIQLEGKRRMPASEFLRGHPVVAGTILGGK